MLSPTPITYSPAGAPHSDFGSSLYQTNVPALEHAALKRATKTAMSTKGRRTWRDRNRGMDSLQGSSSLLALLREAGILRSDAGGLRLGQAPTRTRAAKYPPTNRPPPQRRG